MGINLKRRWRWMSIGWLLVVGFGRMALAQASHCPSSPPARVRLALRLRDQPPAGTFSVLDSGDSLEFINRTTRPLLIVPPASVGGPFLDDIDLEGTWRVINSRVDRWDSEAADWQRLDSHSFVVGPYSAEYFPELELPSANTCDADLRDGMPIPEPQFATITVVYGDDRIELPVTLRYEADPDYAHKLRVSEDQAIQGAQHSRPLTGFGITFYVVIGVLVALAIAAAFRRLVKGAGQL